MTCTRQGQRCLSERLLCVVISAVMLSVANGAPILYVAKELEGQKHVDADVEMEQFLKVYTGTFHNELQREADPKLQFASKIHTRVSLPWLGPRCYFVHEKTDRGGKMIHRLRVASISHAIPDSDDVNVVFVSEHYQFTDQAALEALSPQEATETVEKMDSAQLSLVQGGAVEFRKQPGTDAYDVETKYDSCKDTSPDSKETMTHISGTLSSKGWYVKAVMSRVADGTVVFKTELELDRAPEPKAAVVKTRP